MAETLGFIIGENTIPAELPVIYVTDSNNARSIKKKVETVILLCIKKLYDLLNKE